MDNAIDISDSDMMEESILDDLEEDKKTEKRRNQEDALQDLAMSLTQKFSRHVQDKRPIEQRWIQDYTQYRGMYFQDWDLGFNELPPANDSSTRSRIFVNLTSSKTDSAEARLADMLFPNDDKNWGIDPTPVPELSEALKNMTPLQLDDGTPIMNKDKLPPGQEEGGQDENGEPIGEPLTESDLASAELQQAFERCKKMELEIEDQLVECEYPTEARKMIRDACQLGSGILKGPMQIGKVRRAWIPHVDRETKKVVHVQEIREIVKPYVYRVNPWNFYPDMTVADARDLECTFETHYKTKRQMRDYLKTPGFMESQIRDVLKMEPHETHEHVHTEYLEQMRTLAGLTLNDYDESRYMVLEYHGPIDKEIMERLGMEDVDMEDPLEMYEAFVWFCGGKVIKFALHHLDSRDCLYSVFNWEKDDTNLFGYGVPYQMRAPQKVINSSWRMVLDNAGLSTGPQIIIDRMAVEPADGSWELSPRKIWYKMEEDLDVKKAMATFDIPSHQAELMQIFEVAKKLIEEETNLPAVAQGMAGTAGRTFSGLSMLMNAANITLRRAVKYFDDDITIPIISRMYDWNMQFSDKEEIKGDFDVKAYGSSALLVKEMQTQGLLALAQYIEHPEFGYMLKAEDILREIAKSMHVKPQAVIFDSDTIEKKRKEREAAAQNQSQVSPDVEAKIASQERITMMQAETSDRKLQADMIFKQIDRENLIATLASKENVSAQEIMAKYNIKEVETKIDLQKFYDELAVKAQMGTGI